MREARPFSNNDRADQRRYAGTDVERLCRRRNPAPGPGRESPVEESAHAPDHVREGK